MSYFRRYPYESASAPTTAQDESVGFRDGDLWYHTTAGALYALADQETGRWKALTPNPAAGFYFYEDFATDAATATAGQGRGIETNDTGASTTLTAAIAGSGNHPGQVTSTTGTTATSGATFQAAGSSSIALGGGEWRYDVWFYIPVLSAVAQEYGLLLGFFDVTNAANQVDGAYLLYDRLGSSTGSAASANWQTVTTAGSTRTFTTSSTAVTAATWIHGRVVVNAAASSVAYYIDGVSIVTAHTTNIPTGSQLVGCGWCIKKSAGTTARTVIVDALELQCAFTTPR